MTASRPDTATRRPTRRRARAGAAGALAAAALLAGCATPAPPPAGSPLEPLPRRAAWMPDEAHVAARDLAAAILADDDEAVTAHVARIEALEATRHERGEPATGLVPYAHHAMNASLDDPLAYRSATAWLLSHDDLDETHRSVLEEHVEDDPLRLADERLKASRTEHWGRVFNSLVEPIGRSISSPTFLPLRLASSVLGLALREHQEDALTLHERQALDHWKQFVERNPESPQSAALITRIDAAQTRWMETRYTRSLRTARTALERNDPLQAIVLAERALRYRPEDQDAHDVLEEAERAGRVWAARRERSVGVAADPGVADPAQRDALVAMLLGRDLVGPAEALLAEEEEDSGPLADEACYLLAVSAREAGEEDRAWEHLEELADRDPADANMARHARALVTSPEQNPYRAFREARGDVREEKIRWLAFGPLLHGARDRSLPRPIEWLVEMPAMLGVVTGLPNRLIRLPFMKAKSDLPALLARRYLERHPEGEHADEVGDWLRGFEARRGNHVAALKLAESDPDPDLDADDLAELREKAAEQALEASRKEKRRDVRHKLLAETARTFQGTEAGQEAGELLREELGDGALHHIRISRAFLKEHPRVAGPEGLALAPGLLDGDNRNGELHPLGVTLIGGTRIELAFLGESGRRSKPPHEVRKRLSEERMARLVAQLEEASLEMTLTDPDARVEHDADRDVFFERARLGVLDHPDARSHAEARYSFLGSREKYGLVRSRESILPVEIVLQGSFSDFGLGAFPRMRMPKKTPDHFLYED